VKQLASAEPTARRALGKKSRWQEESLECRLVRAVLDREAAPGEERKSNGSGRQRRCKSSRISRHVQKVSSTIQQLVDHLRSDIDKVNEPKLTAMFETSAAVMVGLNKAFADYAQKNESVAQVIARAEPAEGDAPVRSAPIAPMRLSAEPPPGRSKS
jgi:hypothetical protein